MSKSLGIAGAAFAFLAALFWFASAFKPLPPLSLTWDYNPANDPFFQALRHSVKMNKWAAALSGVSAACFGLQALCGN